MSLDEFSLIREFFKESVAEDVLGVGDDAARMPMPSHSQLVVCKDLLIEGRHFFSDVAPRALGHKALAVNLSDLAAMGAKPIACLLGLGVREANPQWLAEFSAGLRGLSQQWHCPLIGGDTVRVLGETVISVTALGVLPEGSPGLLRSHAQVGDDIWVSGYLGAAHVALQALQSEVTLGEAQLADIRRALEWPEPRLALGQALLGLAHAALDISDGLVQDLTHISEESHCAADIHIPQLPLDPRLSDLPWDMQVHAALIGGDVYELCFSADPSRRHDIERVAHELAVPVTRIGTITSGSGLRVFDAQGQQVRLAQTGFDHFRGTPLV